MTALRSRLILVLIASLALNVFLGGMLVAGWMRVHAWRDAPDGRPTAHRPWFSPDETRGRLPESARAAFREVRDAHRVEMEARSAELRLARAAVEAALAAEPFAPEALDEALAQLRHATLAAQDASHAAMRDLAARLPPEARARLAGRPSR